MSWFTNEFLPSLFSRAGTGHGIWLSRKQTAICTKYMERHTVREAVFQGDYQNHDYYTIEWNGRNVRLNYSKLNGCGNIVFSMNQEERKQAEIRNAEERKRIEAERIACRLRHPETLKKWQERTQKALDAAAESLERCRSDLAAAEAAGDDAEIALCREDIANDEEWYAEKLAEWKIYHGGD